MDTYTEAIKFDRRLEVALHSWTPFPAPSTVSGSGKEEEGEKCLGTPHEQSAHICLPTAPTPPQAGHGVIRKDLPGKGRTLGMKISPQMSRRSQVTLPPCQGTSWSPPYPHFISQMHWMKVNSPHDPQAPPPTLPWCRQAGSISSQQVEKFPGSEEQISPSEVPFPASWEPGSPCPASHRTQWPSACSLSRPCI